MHKVKKLGLDKRLFRNSRFWILLVGILLSINIAGIVQLLIPSGSLQIIRIEQIYGFTAALLLFIALLVSPLTKTYPKLPFKEEYLHARRAIGVLAFYYAFLHSTLAFTKQLGGFNGVQYYNSEYKLSLLFGTTALSILFVLAATSIDWVIRVMSFKRWKLLHRLVYIAGISVIIHMVLIGSHFESVNVLSILAAAAGSILIWFQGLRIYHNINIKKRSNTS